MMTQIKELDTERHTEMNFLEFVEAICRVAHKMQEFPEQFVPTKYLNNLSVQKEVPQ